MREAATERSRVHDLLSAAAHWISGVAARQTRVLFIGAGLLIMGVVAVAAWMIWDAQRLAWEQAALYSDNVVSTLALDLRHVIENYDLSLQSVIDGLKLPETRTVSPQARRLILFDRAADAEQYGAIIVLDETGRQIFDSRSLTPPAENLADREDFRWHRDHADTNLRVGAPVQDPQTGDWSIPLSRRVDRPDGSFGGVVAGSFHVDYIRRLFESVERGRNGSISLFRTDGMMMSRAPFDAREIGRDRSAAVLFKYLRQAPSGSFVVSAAVDGVRRLYTYRRVGEVPLVLSFGQATDTILLEWRQKAVIIGLVVLGLAGTAGLLGLALGAELRRRGRAEHTASESEQRYRLLAENATDVILALGLDRTPRYVSPAAREVLGYAPDEILGVPVTTLIHPSDAGRVSDLLEDLAFHGAGNTIALDTHRWRRKDGSYVWIEAAFRLAVDAAQGSAREFVAALRDVSARKAAEEALAEKNATLSAVLREMPDGIQIFDRDGRMIAWNDQLFELADFTSEERERILAAPNPGRAFRYALAERGDYGPGDPDVLVEGREATARAGRPIHFRRQGESGRWLDIRGVPTADGGWLGAYRDVTEEVAREHELRDASERLEQQAAALCATAEDLARAREVAEGASRSKSAFLANMSHELRTPLNGVIGFAEIMAQQTFGPLGDTRYVEYARDIVDSGRHLLDLINDILDFSKVDAGRLELQEDDVDIVATVGAALRMLRTRAADAQLEIGLRNELPGDVLGLRADERRLKQIVLNLVSNAIKFTPAGGRVTVTLSAASGTDRGGVSIVVADSGIGIAAEDMPRVMEAFGQIDHGLNRRQEGTGLGLPLTKRLVELHGGELHLESEPGLGTTVTAWLPEARVLRAPHREAGAAQRQAVGG
ncbi:MAG TPA: ATP-binding protein [Stellaceae bacterium]|nr:ATP-binding protein [Stellaceae bacterium]